MAEGWPDVEDGAHLLFPALFVGNALGPSSGDVRKAGQVNPAQAFIISGI